MKVNNKQIKKDLFKKVVEPYFNETGILLTSKGIAKKIGTEYTNFSMMWSEVKTDFGIKFISKIAEATRKDYRKYLI